MMPAPIPLTWNEALSGISGSVSLAAWIFLLVPQLVENWRNQDASSVSIAFLLIWFVGDITNLAGAVWAGLVPTVIALAVYFCFADFVLIGQCLYYRQINKERAGKGHALGVEDPLVVQSEESPLLGNGSAEHATNTANSKSPHAPKRRLTDVTEDNIGLPGSHSRRRSSRRTLSSSHRRDSLSRILEESTRSSAWLKNTVSVIMIILAGTAGWAVAWKTGAWRPTPVGHEDDQSGRGPLGAEILGYASAALYLGARLPQIAQNWRQQSTEGLSLLFFLLSVMGNATYGAGILFHSVERQYFLTNLPWLIGSLGTITEDVIIFWQFLIYGAKDEAVE